MCLARQAIFNSIPMILKMTYTLLTQKKWVLRYKQVELFPRSYLPNYPKYHLKLFVRLTKHSLYMKVLVNIC